MYVAPVGFIGRALLFAVLVVQQHFAAKIKARRPAPDATGAGSFTIFEALAGATNYMTHFCMKDNSELMIGSGIRALRYAMEVPGVRAVVANDVSASAVESMRVSALSPAKH